MAINLMKRMESSVYSFNLTLQRICKLIDDTIQSTLSKLIPQNMVLLLECDGQAKMAVYHTKLLQTPWRDPADLTLAIKGLTMDAVWENVIVQVGNIRLQTGNIAGQSGRKTAGYSLCQRHSGQSRQ